MISGFTDIDYTKTFPDREGDLSDFTFLVPLRIDSQERRLNIDTLIKFTFNNFSTNFIILEADSDRKYFPEVTPVGFRYEFIKDDNTVFHRTRWINRLISMADTPFVGVWDSDAIAPPEQILRALEKLRQEDYVMSFPYDGRFYSADQICCVLFRQSLYIEIMLNRIPVMNLMHGYHSVGGAFLVNKARYLETGGENECFYGWGPEDTERVKRLEIKEIKIHYQPGPMFHLHHPMGKNSWFANANVERKNRRELQKTCKTE